MPRNSKSGWHPQLIDVIAAWVFNIGQHIRWKRVLCNEGDHRACWDAPPGMKEVRHAT